MNNSAHRLSGQLILGILAILMGVVFLLDNFGIAEANQVLRYFVPVTLIGFGALKILQSHTLPGYFVGGTIAFLGLVMLGHRLGLLHVVWRDWWPLFLIVIGVAAIIKSIYGRSSGEPADRSSEEHAKSSNIMAILGGYRYRTDSQDFRGGEITSIMGGCEVDLRRASINGDAVMNVFAFWGGAEIKVPTDWNVVVECLPILGGVDDRTIGSPGSGKRLIIRGTAIMGGVGVKN
jgi:predicted membrane protein